MDYVPLHTREHDLLVLMALRELPGHLIQTHIWPHIHDLPQTPGAPVRRGRLARRLMARGRRRLDFE